MRLFPGPVLAASLCSIFFFTSPARAEAPVGDLRTGFFLLHTVCDEESQVGLITMVKTTPPDVADYVKRISKIAKDDLAWIDEVETEVPALKLEKNPLPKFEQDVRASIRADKQHNLLFGTTDAAFARALLLTQIEASNYLMHITKVLAQEDSGLSGKLTRISNHWKRLRDEGVRLSAGR